MGTSEFLGKALKITPWVMYNDMGSHPQGVVLLMSASETTKTGVTSISCTSQTHIQNFPSTL